MAVTVDFSNVKLTWDRNPPNYNAGETIRGTLSGQAVVTTGPSTVQETWGPFQAPVTAEDGTGSVATIALTVNRNVPGNTKLEDVFIDAPAGSVLALDGRNFTVDATRKILTATA